MSKTLDRMTLTEIKRECAHRNLPISATRIDLQCMLEAVIRAEGNNPSTYLLPPRQPIADSPTVDDQPLANNPGSIQEENRNDGYTSPTPSIIIDANFNTHYPPLNLSCANIGNETLTDINRRAPPQINTPANAEFPDLHTIHSIRVASEEIGALRQDMRINTALAQIQLRLSAIETSMTQYSEDQKIIRNRVAKIESDLKSRHIPSSSAFRPIVSPRATVTNVPPFASYDDRTTAGVPQSNSYLNSRLNLIEQEVRETMRIVTPQTSPAHEPERTRVEQPLLNSTGWRNTEPNFASYGRNNSQLDFGHTTGYESRFNDQPNRTVQFSNTHEINEISESTVQNSTLIPIHDLKTARASLPKFSGRKEEDPSRFIEKAESILQQAKIHKSAWVRTVDQQLTGNASDWFNTIRTLDLSWGEFKGELVERFDNPDIQARLRAEIVSFRQGRDQRLTDFVLEKNQLARRVNTGLSETQLNSTVVGLMREEFRIHARLKHPTTFLDLRRIAAVLDVSSQSKVETQNKSYQPAKPKEENLGRFGSTTVTQSKFDKNGLSKAPLPCRYCKGPHWNKDCPNKRSGNGPAPGEK